MDGKHTSLSASPRVSTIVVSPYDQILFLQLGLDICLALTTFKGHVSALFYLVSDTVEHSCPYFWSFVQGVS